MTKLKKKLRNIFIAGLLITVPIAFTYFVLNFLFKKLDQNLSPMFTKLLIWAGAPIPEGFQIPGLGLAMTLIFIFIVGLLATNFFGKKLLEIGEAIVERIPVVRSIYTGTKQVVTSIAKADTNAFRQCVLVEFPRKGVYAMGFVTGDAKGEVQSKTAKHLINIFIPTTPNPTSGFLVFAPQDEVLELKMSIEDGIKLIISGGIVIPPYDENSPQVDAQKVKAIKDIQV